MFFNFDKRIIYIILAILIIYGLVGYLTDTSSIISLLCSIPGVLIAITFHEFAHAKVADILGDDTPRREGRISLNPLMHIDPFGLIMLIFAGFGWGKPVNVNSRNYNRDLTIEKADCIVSLAGPVTNFLLAIIFDIIYFGIIKVIGGSINSNLIVSIILNMIRSCIITNIGLGVFNLIPLPPLDGSKVIKPLLPYNAKIFFENNENIFYYLFIFLWITGIAGNIISPIISVLYNLLINLGLRIL